MNTLQKITLFLFLVFCATVQATAQGKIEFKKVNHQFGQIPEEGGLATVEFQFTNTGNAPLQLTDVKASCGCTTPKWTTDAVAPGATGVVIASYDPMNRPGKFDKTVSVTSNGQPQMVVLTISGEVIPRKKGVRDWYPQEDGNLRFTNKNFFFNKIFNDGKSSQKIVLFNQGNKAITLKMNETKLTLPKHLVISANKTVIPAKDSAFLELSYDASLKNDWGYVTDQFDLLTDDGDKAVKKMFVGANIVENFGNITDESQLPKIKVDKMKHDFGKVNQNTRNTTTFTITNEGVAPLIIRKTKTSCGCTASQPQKTTLASGESTTIDVAYSPGTKQGKQNQNITLISNDPRKSELRLMVEAEVLAPANNGQPNGQK